MSSAQEREASRNGSNGAVTGSSFPVLQRLSPKHLAAKAVVGIVFAAAVAGFAFMINASREAGDELRNANQQTAQTREVLDGLTEISARLSELESAARSFTISGKQSHLDPFYTAAKAVPEQVDQMKSLLRNDPRALKMLAEIEPVIGRHIQAMKDMVDLGKANLFGGTGRRRLTDEGTTLMEEIRAVLEKLGKERRAQLVQEQEAVTACVERVASIGLTGNILATVLVLVVGLCGLRAMDNGSRAERKLESLLASMPEALVIVNGEGKIISSNAQTAKLFGYTEKELQGLTMDLLVPERLRQVKRQYYLNFFVQRPGRSPETSVELCGLRKDGQEFPIEITTKPLASDKGLLVTSAIRDITERKQIERNVSNLNRELKERAVELETANKELEAFSYSVSHDLRSPLQNIDSFSQILVEDYADRLDADGRNYCERLRSSCQHMEEIIDALLALSNMARHELLIERIDLTSMAKGIAAELKQKNPDRIVDWVIADGLTVQGDARLLRVVLENLIGNAWKFTAKRTRARIEFGALPQSNGTRTYFIRDDGAGFDMARAGHLFSPFKRLHDQSQFNGTGIGLATVQRVIQRHRGKIWGEGIVDHGATFCFTITENGATTNGREHQFAGAI